MERNILEISETSNQDQKSPNDPKGQSPSQTDTRTISHRHWITQSSLQEEGEML